jgi:hypothetical protein
MKSVRQIGKQGECEITVDVESTDTLHLVTITAGKKTDYYWAEPLICDYGIGLTFLKMGTSDRHHVNMAEYPCCDCRGFEFHGRCRHIAAAQVLQEAGLLKKAPRPEQAAEQPARQVRTTCWTCGLPITECECDPF